MPLVNERLVLLVVPHLTFYFSHNQNNLNIYSSTGFMNSQSS